MYSLESKHLPRPPFVRTCHSADSSMHMFMRVHIHIGPHASPSGFPYLRFSFKPAGIYKPAGTRLLLGFLSLQHPILNDL